MVEEKNGYIKLYRNIGSKAVWENSLVLKVWLWCLIKAHWQDGFQTIFRGKKKTLKPGQFIAGRKRGAVECDTNESAFYRALKKLEEWEAIRLESEQKKTVVTVIKWESYQGSGSQSEQQTNNKRTTGEQRTNTDEEVKKVRKEEQGLMDADFEQFLLQQWGRDGKMGYAVMTKLLDLGKKHGMDKLREAVAIAAEYNKKSFAYVRGILEPKSNVSAEVKKFLEGIK